MSKNRTAEPNSQYATAHAVMSARPAVIVELVAIVLLALSTLVAVTAVSIEIARADQWASWNAR